MDQIEEETFSTEGKTREFSRGTLAESESFPASAARIGRKGGCHVIME